MCIRHTIILLILCCSLSEISSQTVIRGFVRDSINGMPLSFVNVNLNGTKKTQRTNTYGFFELTDTTGIDTIVVSFKNYVTKKIPVTLHQVNALDILLLPEKDDLDYLEQLPEQATSDKNKNPAVALIRKVIENKHADRIEALPAYRFERYEKSVLSIDNLQQTLRSNKIQNKFEAASNDMETSDFTGQPILTISMKEALAEEYRKHKPETEKTVIVAEKHEGIDNASLTEGLKSIWDETFKDINIFDDHISFLLKKFPSPLSSKNATEYYNYYAGDTVEYKGKNCITVNFIPASRQCAGFSGKFWITPDENPTVVKVLLNIPKESGFRYIERLLIQQEFDRQENGLWGKSYASTTVKFSGFKLIYNLYVKRETAYYHYRPTETSDVAFQLADNMTFLKDMEHQTDSFWIANRPIPLKEKSQNLREAEEAFSESPLFRTVIFTVNVLVSGYIQTGGSKDKSQVDIGPVGTFFSVNEIEGIRLKFGGETTSNLSRHFYLKGFGAYGTKDRTFKYSGTGTWSINGKHPEYDYGVHALSFHYQYDVNTPGEQFFFANKDNVLLSFKHSKDDWMTYLRKGALTYEKENENTGLTLRVWTRFQNEKAAGSLQFLTEDAQGTITDVKSYHSSEIGIRLRYTHNNTFYERRNARIPVNRNAPVFHLTYCQGIKGYLNGDYNYRFAEFAVEKMFWMATYGHLHCMIRTGRIWGELPFPLLILPNANQSYSLQPEAYHLLKPIEFINDKYASLDMEFHFNGVILNHIPFLKKLNLQEVVSFKGLYGGLSTNNLPENNHQLFLFPEQSRTMSSDPYTEASIGIENIFNTLRIDYVRRLTYLNNPDISKNGIRFGLQFSF